ncbi:MAG: YbaB/EbfC family nucleoid-associated protein [Porticoccaceae bacterium]|nr:YbaB/EbfC family nucleoid-associated protein [Porticoccaceae bacterium]|tara:strand:- start:1309 stop:1626 length:318 start_codon:yes stop_codon:yes gene_type:complete
MSMEELLRQAKEMQQKMADLQQEASDREVMGESGGGLVKITMTGRFDARKVELDSDLIKEEKFIIEDLITAAINDAVKKVENGQSDSLSKLTGGLNLPPGFKIPL